MKRIILMVFLLAAFTTGCSYKVTSSSSQTYQGESENWRADYKADFSSSFEEKAGKTYVIQKEKDYLTVMYKNDAALLEPTRHFEISYNDIKGNHSKQTEDSDTPIVKTEFHSGGGTMSKEELTGYLKDPENLHKAIMVYSGPSYEMRTNALINVSIKINGKTETMTLKAKDISPAVAFKTQIEEGLRKMWIEKRYPEYAKNIEEQEL